MVNEHKLLIRSLKMFVTMPSTFSNFAIKTARQYILHNSFITTHTGAAVKLREVKLHHSSLLLFRIEYSGRYFLVFHLVLI